jgi:hypothetical protein
MAEVKTVLPQAHPHHDEGGDERKSDYHPDHLATDDGNGAKH